MEPREAPKAVATPRGRMLPPARASGVARATERSACANRLLRARCASRRSTAVRAGAGRPRTDRTRPCRPASPGWRPLRARLVRHVTKRETIVNGSVTNYFPVIPGRAPGGEPRARHRAGHFGPDPLATIRNDDYPRNAARLTGPPNRPAISFSAPAARASLQPPCLALSTNLSSTSARVSGSCAPPRI